MFEIFEKFCFLKYAKIKRNICINYSIWIKKLTKHFQFGVRKKYYIGLRFIFKQ